MSELSVLFTVGSTRFDALVSAALSQNVLDALYISGFRHIYLQHGHSPTPNNDINKTQFNITTFPFQPSMSEFINRADLVISHAGSGTILEVLYSHRKLIVIANDALMDNHQVELGKVLDREQYLVLGSVDTLPGCIDRVMKAKLNVLKPPNPDSFVNVLKDAVGF
ncbi:undecaprenyldiphospho-muramoylpentapeptide beta-N-acetylglucosaminyltransferase [Synchytrium microbalum]|uniref:UDP-N-acetylglucosamine transferase subunit ALG13 n=1 Tax=Synchytrium microbalum TaxID=1806994 RepID=A0A507CKF4_9FUNG|nr:undecaprenyldiphospho-muramoylpentapeptide beta-N-acetylglucosaminyltransferase [Synchytrium microbalum]TPX38313.1 undecaprenyldiphospho-muramoylpentapeptide beta-N-acetylglucosaminyltransferase [Synchytrium microbalum]